MSQIGAKGKLMKKKTEKPDDLRDDYSPSLIRTGVRGKYAQKYASGTNLVLLAPDVAAAFDKVGLKPITKALSHASNH